MKKILVLFILAFPFILKAQTDSLKTAFVAKVTFDSISTVNDSVLEFRLKEWSDALFEGYLPSQIEEGFGVIDGAGRLFRIDTVLYSTISTAKVRVVKLQERTPADPTGIGAVFEFLSNGMIPAGVSNNLNLTPVTVSRISIHNAVLASEGGGSTNLAYTASPTQGTVNSDTGNDAVIPAADGTNAGLLLPTEKTSITAFADGVGTTEVTDNAITLQKMQNISTNSLLGRYSASTGLVENPTIDATTLKFTGSVLGVDAAVVNYWTLSGSNIWRNSNVGIGVDPAFTGRFIVRGSGTTSSTLTGLFENSGGSDIMTIRDDGLVIIHGTTGALPSGGAGLQINTSNNFNADIWFGGQSGGNSLLRHVSGVVTIGTVTTPSLFRLANSGNGGGYPNFNVGGATNSTFNGIFRAQGATNYQINTTNFDHYQTGSNPVNYVGASGTNNVTGYRVNAGFTTTGGGSNTGYNASFISDRVSSTIGLDTSVFKIKYVAFFNNDSININVPFPDPLATVKSGWRLGGAGGALQRIYDFWTNINDVNGNMGVRSEGTAKSWLRGGVALGETSTINTNNKLEVYGRSSTQQLTGRGTAPGFAVHSTNVGTGASGSIVSAESSDVAGRFTITTGTGTLTTGTWVTITFAGSAFSQAPIITFRADGTKNTQAGLDANILLDNATYIATPTGFTLYVDATLLAALTETRFDISYTIIGGNQ